MGQSHLLCHQTGQGLTLRTDAIRGVWGAKLEWGKSGYEMACCVVPTEFFWYAILQSRRLLFVVSKEHVGFF